MKRHFTIPLVILTALCALTCCNRRAERLPVAEAVADSLPAAEPVKARDVQASDIVIEKQFLYDQHTLGDTYPYQDTVRRFQWDKIKEHLATIENMQREPATWALVRNRRNVYGEPAVVQNVKYNASHQATDAYGVPRYQSIPLYLTSNTDAPERYAMDGSLVRYLDSDSSGMVRLETIWFDGEWLVPERYVKTIDADRFDKVIFVDRTNQNIAVMEKSGDKWLVRSMNPATTGLNNPPYMRATPLGLFVIQEKKERMLYPRDGSSEIGGFAPYANRFCDGAYIHGVPVNAPATQMVEFSPTLGTTPRSHMCVRNATSHAKFIYDWAPTEGSLVVVLE